MRKAQLREALARGTMRVMSDKADTTGRDAAGPDADVPRRRTHAAESAKHNGATDSDSRSKS